MHEARIGVQVPLWRNDILTFSIDRDLGHKMQHGLGGIQWFLTPENIDHLILAKSTKFSKKYWLDMKDIQGIHWVYKSSADVYAEAVSQVDAKMVGQQPESDNVLG